MYQDDEVQVENSPLVICNAVKPRTLDGDEFKCAIALLEPEDPSKNPMYCKNKVQTQAYFNSLPVQLKSPLPGQEGCVFFSGHLNLRTTPETGLPSREKKS